MIIDESGSNKSHQSYIINNSDQYDFVDIFSGRKTVCSPTLMIKTDLLDKLDIFHPDYKIEDLYMLLLITSSGYTIHILKDVLCYYRIHSENVHLNYSYIYQETMKIIDIYKDHDIYCKAKQHWSDWIFPYMAIYQKREAIKILPQIINYRKILKNFQILKLFIPPIILKMIRGRNRK